METQSPLLTLSPKTAKQPAVALPKLRDVTNGVLGSREILSRRVSGWRLRNRGRRGLLHCRFAPNLASAETSQLVF